MSLVKFDIHCPLCEQKPIIHIFYVHNILIFENL
jgi:hypothetical protein